jgi:hypothetical protein
VVTRSRGRRVLIVEGGGDHNPSLQSECREAFCKLQESAGLTGRLARVYAAGGRKAAYDLFCAELAKAKEGDIVVLLVDAEEIVTAATRWQHVKDREGDGWDLPAGAGEEHLHFMAVVMETWLLADPAALGAVFGNQFDATKITSWTALETVPKGAIYAAMKKATASQDKPHCAYDKGAHSFKALKAASARNIEARCPSAKALFDYLRSR